MQNKQTTKHNQEKKNHGKQNMRDVYLLLTAPQFESDSASICRVHARILNPSPSCTTATHHKSSFDRDRGPFLCIPLIPIQPSTTHHCSQALQQPRDRRHGCRDDRQQAPGGRRRRRRLLRCVALQYVDEHLQLRQPGDARGGRVQRRAQGPRPPQRRHGGDQVLPPARWRPRRRPAAAAARRRRARRPGTRLPRRVPRQPVRCAASRRRRRPMEQRRRVPRHGVRRHPHAPRPHRRPSLLGGRDPRPDAAAPRWRRGDPRRRPDPPRRQAGKHPRRPGLRPQVLRLRRRHAGHAAV
ncbi:hypothetical protein EE612_050141 [Oryza sativa]|nr:hypothetical protein EE612_050141 [Oryza sativa]